MLFIYKETTPYSTSMHDPIDLTAFAFVPVTGVFVHVLGGLCSCHDSTSEIVPNTADCIHDHALLEKPENISPRFTLSAWP